MIPKKQLTHTEACALVEEALERVAKTLAYARLRLENAKLTKEDAPLGISKSAEIRNITDRANLLCNINWYGAFIKGVKTAITRLEEYGMLDIPKPKRFASIQQDRIANQAGLKLFLASARNLDWFLYCPPAGVKISIEYTRDKKGKITAAEAKFVKEETRLNEI